MGIIKDKISNCKYSDDIATAFNLQNEVAYYTEYNKNNPFSNDYIDRVSAVYNKSSYKVKRFKEAFKGNILPSLELIDTCWHDLSRVFDPQNKSETNILTTEDKTAEANKYLSKYNDFWRNDSWTELKTRFNSIVVVDLPREQNGLLPEPYPFFLNIGNVRYVELDKEGSPKELIFEENKTKIIDGEQKKYKIYYWYTDEFYSSYTEEEELISQTYHNIGYCPAEFFWSVYLNSESKILRQNNIVPNLEGMFWYTYKSIESLKADLFYLNPDKQKPSSSCGYDKPNQKCFGGKLINANKEPVLDETGTQKLCPNCGGEQHNSGGAGNTTSIDLSAPAIQSGVINPAGSLIQYPAPPIDGVQAQYTRVTDLEQRLKKSISGVDIITTREAINEQQVESGYQSRESILIDIADSYSKIKTWTNKTILKLRYGSSYVSNTYFQGSKFYTRTVSELQESKIASIDPIEKEEIQEQILNVKYKGSPEKLNRERLLYKFLPFSNLSDEQFIEMVKSGNIEERDFILRTDFNNIIAQFEAQRGDILSFFNDYFSEDVNNYKRYKITKELINDLIIIKNKENVQNKNVAVD